MRRALVVALFAGDLGLVLVATAYPFHFDVDRDSLTWKVDNVDWRISPGRPDRDMIQNLLLMVPLGFAMAAAGRARRPWRVAIEAAALSLVVSVGVEAMQLLVPGRCPQLPDVLRNVGGCTAAGAYAAAIRPRLSLFLGRRRPPLGW